MTIILRLTIHKRRAAGIARFLIGPPGHAGLRHRRLARCNAALSEFIVNIRGLDLFLPVTAEFSIPKSLDQNEYHVRSGLPFLKGLEKLP